MYPGDLEGLLLDRLRGSDRVRSVRRFYDLDLPPKPFGVRVTDVDGNVHDLQVTTTSSETQSAWS